MVSTLALLSFGDWVILFGGRLFCAFWGVYQHRVFCSLSFRSALISFCDNCRHMYSGGPNCSQLRSTAFIEATSTSFLNFYRPWSSNLHLWCLWIYSSLIAAGTFWKTEIHLYVSLLSKCRCLCIILGRESNPAVTCARWLEWSTSFTVQHRLFPSF